MVTEASRSERTAAGAAARAIDLTKTYGSGDTAVRALAGVNVGFERGRFTAVMGPSGSGKSTLMHCMAGLDAPTAGHTFIGDVELGPLDDSGLTELRRDRVGFVFQAFNLVPTLTAAENITLPADLAGHAVDSAWFERLVSQLGIADRLAHRPGELSGASSSGSRAPARSSRGPSSSSLTSPQAIWTRTPPRRCWRSCARRLTSMGSRS
jgi:putative ABC transport system ATP-binding protein